MLKEAFDVMRQMLRITEDTQQNRQDIKELKQELRDVARKSEQQVSALRDDVKEELRQLRSLVESLAYEIRRVENQDNTEREKLILQLENQLLKFERRMQSAKPALPAAPEDDSREMNELPFSHQ